MASHASAAPARCRNSRCPSTSSSSQPRSRGHTRNSASWAIWTVSPSMLTSRASTSCSTSRTWASSTATLARGTRARTGVAVLAGHHQAQEQAAEPAALGVVHRVVQRLRRLCDGVLDPAGGEVARHGQRRTLAALPCLAQHVGEQRQCGGLALDLADQQVDQARLELEAGPAARVPRWRCAGRSRPSGRAGRGRPRAPGRCRRTGARSPRWSARSDSTSAPPARRGRRAPRSTGSRSAASEHTVTASSAWSTTRVCRPWGFRSVSESTGCAPGAVTSTGVPARGQRQRPRRRGRATTCRCPKARPPPGHLVSRRRRRQAAASSSRPKKESASSAPYGSSPR